MSSPNVNGRKPLSAKKASAPVLTDDIFGNRLAISPEVQKDLKERGLVGRWINANELYKNQGYHAKAWEVYKVKPSGTIGIKEFKDGRDPDGVIRRGDCILATKTLAEYEKHVLLNQQKADRQKGHNTEAANELRKMAKASGSKAQIHEGYEDADDNE
jgi:uncharacterized protein YjlB